MTPERQTAEHQMAEQQMAEQLGLVELLDLEKIEENIFRGQSRRTHWVRAFGGQVAAQALVAAGRTVERDRPVHSLHSYFIRPGDSTLPIVYNVDKLRDGGSFTTRRVVAVQKGQPIFTLSASFQLVQDGIEHSSTMPRTPSPEELPPLTDWLAGADIEAAANLQNTPPPIDVRYVDPPSWAADRTGPPPEFSRAWMRSAEPLPDDPLLQVCVMTYASDITLLDTVLARHQVAVGREVASMASLDHAMWFLHPFRADDWFLYVAQSEAAVGGRGLAHGRFYDRAGRQLASVVQEGMIRLMR